MDQVYKVRHRVLVEGQGIRRVSRELGVSHNTVKRYLTLAAPVRVERGGRKRPVRDCVRPRLEQLLKESPKWTGGKHRLTAARAHSMLVLEGFKVGLTTVRTLMAEWKRQQREVFVPLTYAPGELAQVDFFEVLVELGGKRQKAWMFVMRWMHSSRDFAWLYLRQDQTSFLDGHVRAFEHFGCVPQRIAYDNLKAAVTKLLVGSERLLASRFEALGSHYLFEASFCRPRTGHDKGGVESRGKAIRWQHLVPIPREAHLDTMRMALLQRLDDSFDPERFAVERAQSLPLAGARFDVCKAHVVCVSRRSLVRVEGGTYSVPCSWAGLDVTVYVGPDEVRICGPERVSVTHPRVRAGARSVDYRHYLSELAKKPQAVRQVAAPLIQSLGPDYAATWRTLVDAHGPRQAARIFAKVLGHIETRGIDAVASVLREALQMEVPPLIALAPPAKPHAGVAAEALPENLRNVTVLSGSAADYDTLLTVAGAGAGAGARAKGEA